MPSIMLRRSALLTLLAGRLLFAVSPAAAGPVWSAEDKKVWNKAIKRVVTTPPCCGACAVLRMEDGIKIYRHVTYEERTPEGAELFDLHRKTILDAVKFFDQERYAAWKSLFPNKEEQE